MGQPLDLHAMTESAALRPGSRLGPHEILSLLGAGGMGQVYKARDTRLDRVVAIKVLSDRELTDAQSKARFEREARAISALEIARDIAEKVPPRLTGEDRQRVTRRSTQSAEAYQAYLKWRYHTYRYREKDVRLVELH